VAFVVTTLSIALIALVVFAPWRPASFVSDSWNLLAHYGPMQLPDLAGRFVPRPSEWYRPLTEVGFWLTWNLFGLNPTGYLALHLAGHVMGAVLVGAIAFALTRNRWAALATAAACLFALQAHELIWDVSDLHSVLSAVAVPAALLAYVTGHRRLALAAVIGSLLVDETGVIILPLVAGYEALYRLERNQLLATARAMARRLAPITAVTVLYLAGRLATGIYSEVANPCRTLPCIAAGATEYLNRLTVRGEAPLTVLWGHTAAIALGVLVLLVVGLVVIAPWRWPDVRPLALGAWWAAAGSLLFVVALWPYVADRFVYVPVMGVGLLTGASVDGLFRSWPTAGPLRRLGFTAAGLAAVGWVGLGAWTLNDRGGRWVEAGDLARRLTAELNSQVTPSPGLTVIVYEAPRFLKPIFPPGNTGPYVFLNGMEWAMRLVYGWPPDVYVPARPETRPLPTGPVVVFRVVDGHVVPESSPRP
jgi:hypothetical protein